MNINQHSFANNPVGIERPRGTFRRNSSVRTTLSAGGLVPFYLDEVLPGDTFDVNTSLVARMTTPIFPTMDDIYLDTYYFFIPHRLVYEHWKELNGENTDSAWLSDVTYRVPHMEVTNDYNDASVKHPGNIIDYLGLDIMSTEGTEWISSSLSALPLRSYKLVWNEWFRDQNLQNPVYINRSDDADIISLSDSDNGVLPVCKFHDYFTSALPSPQKGDPVKIPIGSVPIVTGPVNPSISVPTSGLDSVLWKFSEKVSTLSYGADLKAVWPGIGSEYLGGTTAQSAQGGQTGFSWAVPVNLYTDSGGVFSVNDLRLAFATQRYYEQLARGGSRYNEIILSLFGVHVPDATVQRPEYLGGQRVNIRLNEVVQQSETATTPLGNVAAYSKTTDKAHSFTKSFTEHGYILGVMCIRPNHSYSQGIPKLWTRRDRFDFYIPQFAHLGEQPVKNYEIYYDDDMSLDPDGVFGYQEAWAEYRFKNSVNTGYMRPGVPGSLASWHYGDYYTESPVLSADWIKETPVNVDRTLAVQSDASHQFWVDIYIENTCTRVMPVYSIPGLLDHF